MGISGSAFRSLSGEAIADASSYVKGNNVAGRVLEGRKASEKQHFMGGSRVGKWGMFLFAAGRIQICLFQAIP